jgi:hypothetical protein
MFAELLISRGQGGSLSVPSPLVGEGQGGGCHATRSIRSNLNNATQRLPSRRFNKTSHLGLPPSPTLPHKGGGSAVCLRQERSKSQGLERGTS